MHSGNIHSNLHCENCISLISPFTENNSKNSNENKIKDAQNFGKESGSHTCANNEKSSKDLRLKNWVVSQLCASVQTHLYKSVEQQIATVTVTLSSLIQESDGGVTSIHILSIFIKSFSEIIKTSAFRIISDSSITLSPIHTVHFTRSAFWYKDVTVVSSFLTAFHRYMQYKWHTLSRDVTRHASPRGFHLL